MGIIHGTRNIEALYWNDSATNTINNTVIEVRHGDLPIWAATQNRDEFQLADRLGLGPNWTDYGSSTTPNIASIYSGTARMNITNASSAGVISQWQYNATMSLSDDGWVETSPTDTGSIADSTVHYQTRVSRRMSNGAFTAGVGMEFETGLVRIVMLPGYTVKADCGSYVPGDVIRLTQTGDTHTISVNGEWAGAWIDAGASAPQGDGYQSIGAAWRGALNAGGIIRRSPSLAYVDFT